MARRGPPPKPTHLKLIQGNPGHRPLNTKEPQPKRGRPRCPQWLRPEERKVWNSTARTLQSMGLLTLADGDALAAYARAFCRWQDAENFILDKGLVYPIRDEGGAVRCMQQWPQVSIARNMLLIVKAYQQEFGLTPSARTRIQVEFIPRNGAGAYPEELGDDPAAAEGA